MTTIITAKTVEEAKALAAKTFGVPVSEIKFEVLEEPKKGFLGFKKGEAKVRATYVSIDVNSDDHRPPMSPPPMPAPIEEPVVEDAPAEEIIVEVTATEEVLVEETVADETATEEALAEETVAEETATEEAPGEETAAEETTTEEVLVEETVVEVTATEEVPTVEAVAEESAAEESPAEEIVAEETAAEEAPAEEAVAEEVPVEETASDDAQRVPEDEELVAGEPSEAALAKIELAKEYITSVFKAIDVEVSFEVTAGADSAIINITSNNNGAVIGRRGETLDALQYLTFLVANRGDREFYRIILNSADYRERRRKTLEELATRIAKNVLRSGRTQALEPMNPYERRIVHSTISGIEGVVSRSVNEEPYRKVLISPVNPKRRRKPRNDKDDAKGHNRRDRRKSDAPPERINMDSMKTSFEKDYKRPKAEDEINAGLYGKIEF